jgi:SMC interacting uncharacterized protein involved in chromosome segregation
MTDDEFKEMFNRISELRGRIAAQKIMVEDAKRVHQERITHYNDLVDEVNEISDAMLKYAIEGE